ncbi:NupC/NupG family nucleoside CNT transporter [Bryobacter aggregatus]|uniref:NupC/NupG family nucleoside CNT transporter n=1 Tax=Bryobacter aggregatus TaxID=360054 RepID=UPI0004E23C4D|nr:nucleoside transporter C-terminal domain-containing protein [Bryobacter aggregatus]
MIGLLGLVLILALCYLVSSKRDAIKPRLLFWGLGLQFGFAILVLKTPVGHAFQAASGAVNALLKYSEEGAAFLFGDKLGKASPEFGVIFAFQVLPIVIFIASLFSVLYYAGVMQVVIRIMAQVMRRTMGGSGAESTNVAASIFMGQTEAPLTIKPFLPNLTESELFTIMTSGMAHVSGAVMAAYVKFAGVSIEHLLTAVIMTAPATIMLAKMIVPETGTPETAGNVKLEVEKPGINVIDAAARGAGDGLRLALNIGAMLIAFLSLIALVNGCLGAVGLPTLQQLLGYVFAPVAWLLGVAWNDCQTIGQFLGTRLVLNEFVAFIELGKVKDQLDPRSFTIATFALCGFANLSSIAIQVGGMGALMPKRSSDIARLGLKAVMAGTLANFMSACIAGILL